MIKVLVIIFLLYVPVINEARASLQSAYEEPWKIASRIQCGGLIIKRINKGSEDNVETKIEYSINNVLRMIVYTQPGLELDESNLRITVYRPSDTIKFSNVSFDYYIHILSVVIVEFNGPNAEELVKCNDEY